MFDRNLQLHDWFFASSGSLRYRTLAIGVVLGVYKARTGHLLGITQPFAPF
jgi:hypothetical protein